MIPNYIEILPIIIESLKKDVLVEYSLSWTEYLVLCLVTQFEKKDKQPTPQELIKTSGKNRGSIYKTIRKLSEQGLTHIAEGKCFESGRLYMTPYGTYTLRRINAILARRIREIRKEMNSIMSGEN